MSTELKAVTEHLQTPKTSNQVKAMWAIARRLGMDSDALHAVVLEHTGKTSIKELTAPEADEVLISLGGSRMSPPIVPTRTRQNWHQQAGIDREISPGMRNKIWTLANKRGWTPDQLRAFCERQCGRRFPLTTKQAVSVVEALKSWNKREGIK